MDIDRRATSAIAAAERGDFEHAQDTVIDLVAEDWSNAHGHRAWAKVLLAQGRTADAVGACRTALSLDPQSAELHYDLAEALLADAAKNPYLPLANWHEARKAVLDGMSLSDDRIAGSLLLAAVDELRDRAVN